MAKVVVFWWQAGNSFAHGHAGAMVDTLESTGHFFEVDDGAQLPHTTVVNPGIRQRQKQLCLDCQYLLITEKMIWSKLDRAPRALRYRFGE
jgi:hypothetical protein